MSLGYRMDCFFSSPFPMFPILGFFLLWYLDSVSQSQITLMLFLFLESSQRPLRHVFRGSKTIPAIFPTHLPLSH